jgi:hypothetical protein
VNLLGNWLLLSLAQSVGRGSGARVPCLDTSSILVLLVVVPILALVPYVTARGHFPTLNAFAWSNCGKLW